MMTIKWPLKGKTLWSSISCSGLKNLRKTKLLPTENIKKQKTTKAFQSESELRFLGSRKQNGAWLYGWWDHGPAEAAVSACEPLVPPSPPSSSWYLVADGADVVVLLQLRAAGRGEALDLVDGVSPEQEALPAQLGPQPHVVVGVHQDDGAAHHAPLAEHRLRDAVAHHAHGHLQGEGA